jgi:hypothetical protein
MARHALMQVAAMPTRWEHRAITDDISRTDPAFIQRLIVTARQTDASGAAIPSRAPQAEDSVAKEGLRRHVAHSDKARNGRTGRVIPRFTARIERANRLGGCRQENVEQSACGERGECGRPW